MKPFQDLKKSSDAMNGVAHGDPVAFDAGADVSIPVLRSLKYLPDPRQKFTRVENPKTLVMANV